MHSMPGRVDDLVVFGCRMLKILMWWQLAATRTVKKACKIVAWRLEALERDPREKTFTETLDTPLDDPVQRRKMVGPFVDGQRYERALNIFTGSEAACCRLIYFEPNYSRLGNVWTKG